MDESKKQILQKHWSSIVLDLEVEFIAKKLLGHSVLTHYEKRTIDEEVSAFIAKLAPKLTARFCSPYKRKRLMFF